MSNVESQSMKFSFTLEEFEIEKSDIDDRESDLETKDNQFYWGVKTDQNFSYQDFKNPIL